MMVQYEILGIGLSWNVKCMQVAVEWAANWCSLCLEADLMFAQLAANLAREGVKGVKLVRVNLDKAEVSPHLSSESHQKFTS